MYMWSAEKSNVLVILFKVYFAYSLCWWGGWIIIYYDAIYKYTIIHSDVANVATGGLQPFPLCFDMVPMDSYW